MRHFTQRRPTPALVVAFVALLAALSGTAVALPGINTVDSGDIKNSTIRSKDIRNNNVRSGDIRNNSIRSGDVRNSTLRGIDVRNESLTGADIRGLTGADVNDDSLTGADVNEGTLAKVPSAAIADSTARAASAGSVDGRTPFLVKLAAGQSQTVATHGAVSIVVDCINDGANDIVRILGATSVGGAAMGGNDAYTGAPGDTLEPTTLPEDRVILNHAVATGVTDVSWNIDAGWVMAPDGSSLGIDGETTALGLNYAGATCVASGVVNAAG